jgi:hypothetical protein
MLGETEAHTIGALHFDRIDQMEPVGRAAGAIFFVETENPADLIESRKSLIQKSGAAIVSGNI